MSREQLSEAGLSATSLRQRSLAFESNRRLSRSGPTSKICAISAQILLVVFAAE